jgi:hypothetical protein
MKIKDVDIITRLIFESTIDSTAIASASKPIKRPSRIDEEKFVRMRQLFDEKYRISTPLELLRL